MPRICFFFAGELLVGEDALGVQLGELLDLGHVVVALRCGGRRLRVDDLRLLGVVLRLLLRRPLLVLVVVHPSGDG